jgi:site-specific recombinase XerD
VWPRFAIPNLAPDTRRRYLEVWSVHLLPRLRDYELREITPMAVEDFREQMTRAKVGAPTQRKALMLLQGILRRAVVRGLIPVNPAQLVDKPKQRPARLPQPLSPVDDAGRRGRALDVAWQRSRPHSDDGADCWLPRGADA